MPGGDRTGPMGQGPTTGRALGYCRGYETTGFTKGFGRGMDNGFRFRGGHRGRGVGIGRGPYFDYPSREYVPGYPWAQSFSKEDEIKHLREQSEFFKRNLEEIGKRLSELENKDD